MKPPPRPRGRPRIHIDRATIRCTIEQLKQLVRAGSTWADAELALAAELGVCAATLRSRIRALRQGDMTVFEPPAAAAAMCPPTYEEPSPEALREMLEHLLS
jgi:hypothetical protein